MTIWTPPNTRTKRYALIAAPFVALPALYHLAADLDNASWQPSLAFCLLTLTAGLCLAVAFTRLDAWLR